MLMICFIYSREFCSNTLWQKSVAWFDSHQIFVVCSHSSPEVLQCVPQAPEFGVLCFGRRLRVLLDLNSAFLHQHGRSKQHKKTSQYMRASFSSVSKTVFRSLCSLLVYF